MIRDVLLSFINSFPVLSFKWQVPCLLCSDKYSDTTRTPVVQCPGDNATVGGLHLQNILSFSECREL